MMTSIFVETSIPMFPTLSLFFYLNNKNNNNNNNKNNNNNYNSNRAINNNNMILKLEVGNKRVKNLRVFGQVPTFMC